MKAWKLIPFSALAVAGFLVARFIILVQPLRFGANEIPQTQSIAVVLYGYVVTLAGVTLGSTYRQLQQLREDGKRGIGSPATFFKGIFVSVDFWMSICGSPIVYALLWKSLDGGNVAGLSVMALENGFCCTMIVNNFLKSGPPELPTRAAAGNDGRP